MNITQAKQHLRVLHNLEDGLIQTYLNAATDYVAAYLGYDLENLPDPIPDAVQAAILLLTGDLYVNRERQGDRTLSENTAYVLLLAPYRSMAVL